MKWAPIPIGLGFAYFTFMKFFDYKSAQDPDSTPTRYRGPWYFQSYAALPLKSISRLFGAFNEIVLPTFLRAPGYKLYAWFFNCNLDEMKDPVLENYPNLSSFFFRELKDGVRPIADSTLVSPADGRVLHFGEVTGSSIEQIKGVTYSLDDLLGRKPASPTEYAIKSETFAHADEKEFAQVNGINYSLDDLLEGNEISQPVETPNQNSTEPTSAIPSWHTLKPGNKLFFSVIYLAPGDYHRFHSPSNWVVHSRRHFAGELYSVSPFMAKYFQNLFVLNERVALVGKWRHGFFSMLPVGATNVGSIKIHFDEDLKTNEKRVRNRGTYTEVSYQKVSSFLKGYPLQSGQEIGGFCLGSTIVLVFEAPQNFQFNIEAGQKIKMGERMGDIL
jgi:phosphatidylserine decarboxylase